MPNICPLIILKAFTTILTPKSDKLHVPNHIAIISQKIAHQANEWNRYLSKAITYSNG